MSVDRAPNSAWRVVSVPPPLAMTEVHVWRSSVDATPDLTGTLSPAERERADRFRRGRRRFVAARGMLRRLVGAYLDEDPSAVEFRTGKHGKPFLEDSDLRFSVSHSGDLVLLAFARSREVGVDVEEIRGRGDEEGLARRFFRADEAAVLAAVPPERRLATFHRMWCRKEAVLKATGLGVTMGLDRFRVSAGDAAETVRTPDGASWSVRTLDVGEGYAAALAVAGESATCRLLGLGF